MSASKRALPSNVVDFDTELAVLAESAVSYHRNDHEISAGSEVGTVVASAFVRAATLADEAEQKARSAQATACRKGCAWCCHQNVRVSAAEAFHLARRLRASFAADELAALAAHARDTAARLKGMPQLERARARIACALLDPATGSCRAHDSRPLLCRGQLSVSARTCQQAVESPDESWFEPLLDAIHAAGLGSLALEVEFGFIGGGPVSGELTAMLAVALNDPTAETRWLRGENPFPRHNEFSTHMNSRLARMLVRAWAALESEAQVSAEDEGHVRAAAMKFLREVTGADEPLH